MKHSALLLVLAAAASAAAGCAPPQPVVATPAPMMRVDTAVVRDSTPGPAVASPIAATSAPRVGEPAAESPFFTTNRIDWPGPNRYRSAGGAPGPDYWQQRADYTIAVTLDTTQQTVSGTVTIRYTNNSPDSLRYLWLQVDQNLYRPGSKGSALFSADSRWGVRGFEGGYTLDDVTLNGARVEPKVDDTMMRLDVANDRAIAPRGGRATITMRFSFRVPEHGSDRMGRDGTLYEMAQWYPRMAVYDDVRGWNTDPYFGQGEFYLEYGDIDYAVTVPAGYTVAGSGVLRNGTEVLTAAQRQRLARAARTDSVVQVIQPDEATAAATAGTKTWRFRAENVRDVAWAAAPGFRWDATSRALPGRPRVLCQAYYQVEKAGTAWASGAEQTCWSIRHYSELVYQYPYPQATSVAGPVGGMEYPMFVMVHYGEPKDDANSIFGTIDHEHGHEWFPMIVGSNERRYAWQDEGFNTYINAFANERRFAGTERAAAVVPGYLRNWRTNRERGFDVPLMTRPDHIEGAALGALGYRKPGAVLLALRNGVVGAERFDAAFREYTRRWAFRHPTPGDFFRTIENGSGMDLSWFWRGFFYTTDVLDIAVDGVTMSGEGGEQRVTVQLRRTTPMVFPVSMRLKLADGSTQDVRLPVDVWVKGERIAPAFPVRAAVVGVRLWYDGLTLDWQADNDTWGDAPAGEAMAGRTTF